MLSACGNPGTQHFDPCTAINTQLITGSYHRWSTAKLYFSVQKNMMIPESHEIMQRHVTAHKEVTV